MLLSTIGTMTDQTMGKKNTEKYVIKLINGFVRRMENTVRIRSFIYENEHILSDTYRRNDFPTPSLLMCKYIP